MSTAPATSRVTSVFGAPIKHFVQGRFTVQRADGTSKSYTITPILLRDRKEAIEFLATYCDEFYRDGKPFPAHRVASRVDTLIQRFIHNEAWSSWLVRDEEDNLAAWWTIGYDERDGDLHLALMIKKEYQNQKVATGIWQFTTRYLFPILTDQKAVVKSQKDLKTSTLYTLTHPDHKVMNDALAKAGFQLERKTYEKNYENKTSDGTMIHDGSRNRWKLPVAQILAMSK